MERKRILLRFIPATVILFAIIIFVSQACIGNSQAEAKNTVPEEFFNATPSIGEQLFLSKIRKEIGLGDGFGNTMTMMVGPFSSFEDLRVNGEVVHIDPDFRSLAYLILKESNYYIAFDHSFYNKISAPERLFVIAHEAWHAQKKHGINPKEIELILDQIPMKELRKEVESDFFAAKYVDPEIIKDFLAEYCNNKNELGWRVWALVQLQELKRGLDP